MIFGELRQWLNNFSRNTRGRAAGHKRARSARPGLELLEDRAVPAVGLSVVNDNWDFVADNDASNSLTVGDTIRNNNDTINTRTLTRVYGVDGFGTVATGQFTGSVAGFATINDAIFNTISGGTVEVLEGTYAQSVTVNKSLTVLGAQHGVDARTSRGVESVVTGAGNNGVTPFWVTADDVVLDGFTVQGQTQVNQYGAGIVLAAGTEGSEVRNNIIQDNVVGIFLANDSASNPTVIERNLIRDNDTTGASNGTGIYTDPTVSGPTLTNVVIRDNRFAGANYTWGINLQNATNATITGNAFEDGNAARLANVDNSSFTNNAFSGALVNPPSGFQVTGLNVASVSGNGSNNLTVSGNTFTNRRASAINVAGANSNLTLTNNTVTQDVSLFAANTNRYMISLTGLAGTNNITANTITLTGTMPSGAGVNGIAVQGNFTEVVNVSGNTITGGNTDAFTGTNDSHGIGIFGSGLGLPGTPTPVFSTVNVTNNFITGWVDGVALPNSHNSRVTININSNSIAGNSHAGLVASSGTGPVNAMNNWWGSPSGPAVASNPGGTGASIVDPSGRVDYSPWLTTGADVSADPGFQGDFSKLTVNATSPRHSGQTSGNLQEGVDQVTAGGTVNVLNGTYYESNISVTKAVTIAGQSRAGVIVAPAFADDHTDSRFGGTVSNAFVIRSSGVTIQTLTIDGNGNAGLSGSENYRAAVITDNTVGNFDNVHVDQLTIKNIYRRGVELRSLNAHTTGYEITNSTFDNVGLAVADTSGGYAIVIIDGDALISDNVVTNSGTGVGTNYTAPAKAPLVTIQRNNISGVSLGMNLSGLAAGSVIGGSSANANTISGSGSDSIGILLQYATGLVTIDHNDVSGFQDGIYLYNLDQGGAPSHIVSNNTVHAPATVAGSRGIHLSSSSPFDSDNGLVKATLVGNTITGYETGISVVQGSQSVAVTFGAGNSVTGGTTGLLVNGASATIVGATLSNLAFSGQSGNYVTLTNAALDNLEIDGTSVSFDGVTGATATPAQLFAIEDKIRHATDDSSLGFIRVKAGNVFVTQNSGSIQRGVDVAVAGDTLNVAAGTYDLAAGVTIDKPLTLLGAKQGVAGTDASRGTGESVLNGPASQTPGAFTFNTPGPVALNGFTFNGSHIASGQPAGIDLRFLNNVFNLQAMTTGNSMILSNPQRLTLTNNKFTTTGSNLNGSGVIQVEGNYAGTGTANFMDVTGNTFLGIPDANNRRTLQLTFNNVQGNVQDNVFDGVDVGVLVAGTSGNLTISGNTFRNITRGAAQIAAGSFGAGVVFYNPTLSGPVTLSNNTFQNSDAGFRTSFGGGGPFTLNSPTVGITGNTFTGNVFNIVDKFAGTLTLDGDNVFDGVTLSSATTAQLFAIADKIVDAIDVSGYGLVRLKAGNVYVTPNSGSIQRGIDAASAGDTINIQAGTYAESVNVNKAVTLSGNATITGSLTITSPGSAYDVDLNGASHDQLNVTGSVNLGGALNVSLPSASAVGDEFVIINNDGSDTVNGTFATLPEGTILTFDGQRFQLSYAGGDGNDVTLTHVNTPPVLTNVQLTPRILEDGTAVLTGTVSDPNSADSFVVRVVWGDGSSSVVTVAAGQTTFLLTHKYTREGNLQVDVTVTDATGGADVAVRQVEVVNKVVATVAYRNGRPVVQVRDAETQKVLRSFFPFGGKVKGQVRVAVGDVNGDVIPDVVVVPMTGFGGLVRVFNSQTGAVQYAFRAFPDHRSGPFTLKLNANHDIVMTTRVGNRVLRRVFDGHDGHRLSSEFIS